VFEPGLKPLGREQAARGFGRFFTLPIPPSLGALAMLTLGAFDVGRR
jgi:hypothetical protein